MDTYDPKAIEQKWQKRWREDGAHQPDMNNAPQPFYNLMMFPYPSAEGLHVGNMYAFTGADIYGRYKRMNGFDVFEPIGLDGFGIHSENYAMKTDQHPMELSKKSEENFYRQLQLLGNAYAWDNTVETYKPEYYRWTQWVFAQMFDRGLAYRKNAPVNWCPGCKTVLADEQVIAGLCERCDSEVEKRDLEQWFFRTTLYAQELLDSLDAIDWSEKVKIAQRNWIGRSEGARITFALNNIDEQDDGDHSVEVFTTRPDTLFGATFMAVSPEKAHEWMELGWKAPDEVRAYVEKALTHKDEERAEKKEKTGVDTGITAVNPATKKDIPVWVADYVLGSVGTGAIMAVPAHDERDYAFAHTFDLPIVSVISPSTEVPESPTADMIPSAFGHLGSKPENFCYTGDGTLINSGDFTGMESEEAKWKITDAVGGERTVTYRLRDWLISRQRYWGPPIPLIHCDACEKEITALKAENDERPEKYTQGQWENPGWVSVPADELPVELPYIEEFRPEGTGTSPLAAHKDFHQATCPVCGGNARRETDVSDTFLDSAWYYFRYIDTENSEEAFNQERAKRWLPVDMYIGGAEHSVLHLLYTRFLTKVFHDWDLIEFDEPFTIFRAHGLIIKEGAKMSKSKGNVVNPDEYIERFGADALRMYLMFLGPFDQGGDFRESGISGIERFLNRVWDYMSYRQAFMQKHGLTSFSYGDKESELKKIIHQTIKKVTEDIKALKYNTAISQLMICMNYIDETIPAKPTDVDPKGGQAIFLNAEDANIFLKLLNPFAPHFTQELWSRMGNNTFIDREQWPEHNPKLIIEDTYELIVQINGKTRDTLTAQKGIDQKTAEELARSSDNVMRYLEDASVKKIIFVPDRLINFVVQKG